MSDELVRAKIVYVAQKNLGYGEEGGNNVGPLLRAIGAPVGAEWCAYFAWYCYRRGAELAKLSDMYQVRGSGNAKRLGRGVASSTRGRTLASADELLPGDLVVWHRGLNPFKGHVAVVEHTDDGLVHTIEGNVGKVPAKVKRLVHDLDKERVAMLVGLR